MTWHYIPEQDGPGTYLNDEQWDALNRQQDASASQAAEQVGVPRYTGQVTAGLRGDVGGENAHWGVDPRTGKEVPAFQGPGGWYLLPDLLQKYGSMEGIMNAGRPMPGTPEFQAIQDNPEQDPTGNQYNGWFGTQINNFGRRPNNDTFSGKDGLHDLITIAAMAAPVVAGAAGAYGAAGAGGADAAAVGADAAAGGAGTDALAGGASAGGGATAAGTGAFDLGGGMSVDAYGNIVGSGAGAGTGAAGAAAYDLGSGMSVDAYGNVVSSGAAAGGAGLGGILSNPGLIGAGLGALVGGQAGGAKPAGTTTSTSDVPAWLMPYVTGNLNAATGVRDSLASGPNATDAAMPGYMATINGDYLNPDSNPYLKDTFQHAANLVGANIDSKFESAGRYGSGAHQGVLQEGFNNLATQIYGGNYQAERARQASAITGAPAFDTGRATAAFAPFSDYASLFPGKSTATTTPYFTNTAGGILGGALAGSQISKLFT